MMDPTATSEGFGKAKSMSVMLMSSEAGFFDGKLRRRRNNPALNRAALQSSGNGRHETELNEGQIGFRVDVMLSERVANRNVRRRAETGDADLFPSERIDGFDFGPDVKRKDHLVSEFPMIFRSAPCSAAAIAELPFIDPTSISPATVTCASCVPLGIKMMSSSSPSFTIYRRRVPPRLECMRR